MADHTPPLESGQLLSPELPMLASPPPLAMVNGDGPQQVILVQVNPGEAFTIRREDGQFQCITASQHQLILALPERRGGEAGLLDVGREVMGFLKGLSLCLHCQNG
ncbi:hypothetical protein JOQ06_017447 [Pogonophryne albipinna]|uniref:Uncharacterized protein n=1 Tax=Pogonophryne albipinna TaxID=1090488 RepID=A0AAD6B175_9TELE|nr:hypothetical protein JOQ06_017447 [Pogonophryne albipinna]